MEDLETLVDSVVDIQLEQMGEKEPKKEVSEMTEAEQKEILKKILVPRAKMKAGEVKASDNLEEVTANA